MRVERRAIALSPPVALPPRASVHAATAAPTPPSQRILSADAYEQTLRVLRHEPSYTLPVEAREALAKSSPAEQRIISFALRQLTKVSQGRMRSSDYFITVLREAVRLSGGNAERFVALQGLAFNEKKEGWYEGPRRWLGAGHLPAGAPVEETFQGMTRAHGESAGNNPNIIDRESLHSSVTHHFAEFLRVGMHSLRILGNLASWYIDSKRTNPGDVRSGYFAVMLGRALHANLLTPEEAIRLIEWAYTDRAPGATPPPWGWQDTGTHLRMRDFRIAGWIAAYNCAHPSSPI